MLSLDKGLRLLGLCVPIILVLAGMHHEWGSTSERLRDARKTKERLVEQELLGEAVENIQKERMLSLLYGIGEAKESDLQESYNKVDRVVEDIGLLANAQSKEILEKIQSVRYSVSKGFYDKHSYGKIVQQLITRAKTLAWEAPEIEIKDTSSKAAQILDIAEQSAQLWEALTYYGQTGDILIEEATTNSLLDQSLTEKKLADEIYGLASYQEMLEMLEELGAANVLDINSEQAYAHGEEVLDKVGHLRDRYLKYAKMAYSAYEAGVKRERLAFILYAIALFASSFVVISVYRRKTKTVKSNVNISTSSELELEILDKQDGMTYRFKKVFSQFVFTVCRGQLLRRLGQTPDMVEGKTLYDAAEYEIAKRRQRYYSRAWDGLSVKFEETYEDQQITILTQLEPVIRGGKVYEVVGYTIDISEEKQKEFDLAEAKSKLEGKNRELQQLNDQLENAIEQANRIAQDAEIASTTKSDFLAKVSHEIRTPMNAIIGMANLLEDSELNDEHKNFAKTITANGNRMMEIISNVLDFSKIEAGLLQLEPQIFMLHDLADEMIDLFGPKFREKKLEFFYEIAQELQCPIACDNVRLRQILVNLISNAIKFTDTGLIHLQFSMKKSAKGCTLYGTVSDTGIGIEEEKQAEIFHEYIQADSSPTRRYEGTGLGLSISKRLCEMMHGDIKVESVAGQGSKFTFNINYKEAQDSSTSANQILQKTSIVILSDNPLASTLASALQNAGASTELLQPSDTAHIAQRCDLIIFDINPKLEGAKGLVQQSLEKVKKYNSKGIILINDLAYKRKLKIEEQESLHYLQKPIKHCELVQFASKIIKPEVKSSYPVSSVEAKSAEERIDNRNFNILLVEDNLSNQKVNTLILERMGFNVTTAKDGKEALSSLSLMHFHLIFMDIFMPEMDGLEATRLIRKTAENTPYIVALTGAISQHDREQCFDAGMNAFLSKPLSINELNKVIENFKKDYKPQEMHERS
jgi:signal transduction histidine kinase/CheY-like chemotaxis protein